MGKVNINVIDQRRRRPKPKPAKKQIKKKSKPVDITSKASKEGNSLKQQRRPGKLKKFQKEKKKHSGKDDNSTEEENNDTVASPSSTSKPPPPPPPAQPKCPKCDIVFQKLQLLKHHLVTHYKDVLYSHLPRLPPYECPECKCHHRDIITLGRHYAFAHKKILTLTDLSLETLTKLGVVFRGPKSKTSKRCRHRSGLQPNTSNANLPASSSSDDAAGKTNLTDNSLNQESAAETSSAESAGLGSAAVATELRCSSVANSVSSTPDGGKEEGGKTLDQMSGIDGRESRSSSRSSYRTDDGQYRCNECPYTSRHLSSLRRHRDSIHLGKRYNCPDCGYSVAQKAPLKAHILRGIHTKPPQVKFYKIKDGKYHCTDCEFIGANFNSVQRHFDKIHRQIPLQCHLCEFSTSHKQSLARHVKSEHSGASPMLADKTAPSPTPAAPAITAAGDQAVPKYGVEVKINPTDSGSLEAAEKMCPDERRKGRTKPLRKDGRFACPDCDFTSAYKISVYRHIDRFHRKIRYTCDQCEHSTSQMYALKLHKETVHRSAVSSKSPLEVDIAAATTDDPASAAADSDVAINERGDDEKSVEEEDVDRIPSIKGIEKSSPAQLTKEGVQASRTTETSINQSYSCANEGESEREEYSFDVPAEEAHLFSDSASNQSQSLIVTPAALTSDQDKYSQDIQRIKTVRVAVKDILKILREGQDKNARPKTIVTMKTQCNELRNVPEPTLHLSDEQSQNRERYLLAKKRLQPSSDIPRVQPSEMLNPGLLMSEVQRKNRERYLASKSRQAKTISSNQPRDSLTPELCLTANGQRIDRSDFLFSKKQVMPRVKPVRVLLHDIMKQDFRRTCKKNKNTKKNITLCRSTNTASDSIRLGGGGGDAGFVRGVTGSGDQPAGRNIISDHHSFEDDDVMPEEPQQQERDYENLPSPRTQRPELGQRPSSLTHLDELSGYLGADISLANLQETFCSPTVPAVTESGDGSLPSNSTSQPSTSVDIRSSTFSSSFWRRLGQHPSPSTTLTSAVTAETTSSAQSVPTRLSPVAAGPSNPSPTPRFSPIRISNLPDDTESDSNSSIEEEVDEPLSKKFDSNSKKFLLESRRFSMTYSLQDLYSDWDEVENSVKRKEIETSAYQHLYRSRPRSTDLKTVKNAYEKGSQRRLQRANLIEICNYYDNSDTNDVAAADEDDSSADGACDSIEDVHDPRDNPAPSRFRVFQKLPSVLSERTKKLYEAKFKEDDRVFRKQTFYQDEVLDRIFAAIPSMKLSCRLRPDSAPNFHLQPRLNLLRPVSAPSVPLSRINSSSTPLPSIHEDLPGPRLSSIPQSTEAGKVNTSLDVDDPEAIPSLATLGAEETNTFLGVDDSEAIRTNVDQEVDEREAVSSGVDTRANPHESILGNFSADCNDLESLTAFDDSMLDNAFTDQEVNESEAVSSRANTHESILGNLSADDNDLESLTAFDDSMLDNAFTDRDTLLQACTFPETGPSGPMLGSTPNDQVAPPAALQAYTVEASQIGHPSENKDPDAIKAMLPSEAILETSASKTLQPVANIGTSSLHNLQADAKLGTSASDTIQPEADLEISAAEIINPEANLITSLSNGLQSEGDKCPKSARESSNDRPSSTMSLPCLSQLLKVPDSGPLTPPSLPRPQSAMELAAIGLAPLPSRPLSPMGDDDSLLRPVVKRNANDTAIRSKRKARDSDEAMSRTTSSLSSSSTAACSSVPSAAMETTELASTIAGPSKLASSLSDGGASKNSLAVSATTTGWLSMPVLEDPLLPIEPSKSPFTLPRPKRVKLDRGGSEVAGRFSTNPSRADSGNMKATSSNVTALDGIASKSSTAANNNVRPVPIVCSEDVDASDNWSSISVLNELFQVTPDPLDSPPLALDPTLMEELDACVPAEKTNVPGVSGPSKQMTKD